MKNVAIICEFNPFHNGHKLLFDRVREHFAPEDVCLVCIMSSNFVQRGTLAVMSKYKRAEIAADMGADVVLELPFPYSASYAQSFARTGVYIADNLGGIDFLAFGSESFDEKNIVDCAEKISVDEFENTLAEMLKENKNSSLSYAALRSQAFERLYGKELPIKPNDILALEYVAAINKLGSKIKPLFIHRNTDFSATESRKYIFSDNEDALGNLVPEGAYEKTLSAPKFSQYLPDAAILLFLAQEDPKKLAESPEMSYDLASRLVNAAKSGKYKTVRELLSAVSTKKYTDARIRRALNFAYLGVKREDLSEMPQYTLLLASSENGRKTLREFSKSSKISLLATKAAHNKLFGIALRQYELSEKADRAFAFCGEISGDEGIKPYVK